MKNNDNKVKIFGLELDKNNNFYMEIGIGNNEYEFIETDINIKEIFRGGITRILHNYQVLHTKEDIERFLDVFVISNEYGLEVTELYRGFIDVEVDEYLKKKFNTKSGRRCFGKIDRNKLEEFLDNDFKEVAIGYILKEYMYFLKHYTVILDKPIKMTRNGHTAVMVRVRKEIG